MIYYEFIFPDFAGQFYHIGQVCWEDPTGLIDKESRLTTRRVLSEFYFQKQQRQQTSSSPSTMKDFFLNKIGVDRFPPASEYLVLINNMTSKTQLPNPDALRDIFKLFQILGSLCIQEDMKKTLYQWRMETNFENNLKVYQSLEQSMETDRSSEIVNACQSYDQIFPTHQKRFVGLKSNSHLPIVVFNKELAKVFEKNEHVDFIFVDGVIRILEKSNEPTQYQFKRGIDGELLKILFLFKACGFPTLTDLYLPPDIAPGQISTGCYVWENQLHQVVSYIQQYIYTKHPDHYERLKGISFSQYLKKSVFFTTPGFEVVYRLKNHDKATQMRTKVAYVEHCVEENGGKFFFILLVSFICFSFKFKIIPCEERNLGET